ncbi:hypothetical protein P7C71_g86, partial [Lecanoromycetidae sp. Uapishka_2]
MASSRFSTFIDPAIAGFSRFPESQASSFTRREAKQQESVIRKRLEAADDEEPKGNVGSAITADARKEYAIALIDYDEYEVDYVQMQSSPNQKIEEKYLRVIARELAKGLKAIHQAGVIHRDIKAGNVMVHEEGGIQIIDFGVAGQVESAVDKRATVVGTPHWMSPELLGNAEVKYGKEVDTWSYGCTLYEMAMGYAPNPRVPRHMLQKKHRLQGVPKLQEQDGYSAELCDLVAFTLVRDPKQRPSMDEILGHPYLQYSEEEYPITLLAELVDRHKSWEAVGGQRASLIQPYGAEAAEYHEIPYSKGEWRFSTIASTESVNGLDFDSPLSTVHENLHIDPIADMKSTQAQEDTMNSYFAGEPSEEASEPYSHSPYTPGPSPRSFPEGSNSVLEESAAPDGKRVQRGGNHLGALFDPSTPDYTSPALEKKSLKSKQDGSQHGSSDLPLRSQNASATDLNRSDTETSSQGSFRLSKKVSNIDTDKANRYARPTTMDWDFPSQNLAAASTTLPSVTNLQPESSSTSHPNLSEWKAGYESDIAPSPSRPPLRHAETAPSPHDFTRGSRLDMDALMGDLGDDIPNFYAPTQAQPSFDVAYPTTMPENDDGGLDLDAMMGEFTPLDEPYQGGSTNDDVDTAATSPPTFPLPTYPGAEAMAEGASEAILEADLVRMLGNFSLGLEALGTQFEQYLEDEYESTDGDGNESE